MTDRTQPALDRAAVVDIAFAVVATAIGVVGFRTSFAGNEALAVGLPGVALGTAVGLAIVVKRLPLLVGALVAVVAFFVLGPVAGVRANAIAGVVPTPASAIDLVDGTINGWIRLLTTVPPAGQAGNLTAIPYLAGFAGACATVVSAIALRRNASCIVPPSVVMAVSVLFGVERPAALLLQGAAFGAVLVGWVVVRNRRREVLTVSTVRSRRAIEGVAMLGVAAVGGLLAGPLLPFVDTDDRYVLREVVEPPFDPSQYPSPLARFRAYHGTSSIDEPLFEVTGLPAGTAIRYSVMDHFDGFVWRSSAPRTVGGGSYERVGPRIPHEQSGERAEVRFRMKELADREAVWIPTVGVTEAVSFEGPNDETLTNELRFNREAQAAAAPLALTTNDRWSVQAVLPEARTVEELRNLPVAQFASTSTGSFPLTDKTRERVATWTEGAASPYTKVEAVITKLKDVGAYNDGLPETPIAPGHSLYRLTRFMETEQPQGNGEQYAAAVAYIARSLGIPARVVLEFVPAAPADPSTPVDVMAKDARAMVEIALDGAGWVAVPNPTPDENDKPTPQVAQIEKQAVNEVQPPPPSPPKPPAELPDNPPPARKQLGEDGVEGWLRYVVMALKILGYVAAVATVVVGPALLIVAVKARRRRRRRSAGSASARVLGAWQELTDRARDYGQLVPAKATRREVGAVVPLIGTHFPEHVDQLLFGPGEPGEAEVDEVWSRLDELERELLGGKSRAERIRGAISLTSLR